jgi:hypothetical protein
MGFWGNRGHNPRDPPAKPPTCCACFSRIESRRAADDSIRTLRTADRFQPQALGRTAGRSRAGTLTAPNRDRSAWTHPHDPSAGTQARQLPKRSSTPSKILAHRGTCYHRVSTLNLRWRQSPRRRVVEVLAALKNCAQRPVWYARPKCVLRCFRFPTRRRKSPKKSSSISRQVHKWFGSAIRTEPWSSTFYPPEVRDASEICPNFSSVVRFSGE